MAIDLEVDQLSVEDAILEAIKYAVHDGENAMALDLISILSRILARSGVQNETVCAMSRDSLHTPAVYH